MSLAIDVLIIGGGPAGLATALALCRARHTCVVFDSGTYRNSLCQYMHSVPTWDHADPALYRDAARKELTQRYTTVQLVDRRVLSVVKTDQGDFLATDEVGKTWTGRKLVLATGVKDAYPDLPGYGECWVTGIFHCLFCHGYEESGTPTAGVLAVDDLALFPALTNGLARNALQFASEVTVYTPGSTSIAETIQPLVQKKGILVDARRIAKLIKSPTGANVTIVFEDASQVTHGFLVHKPKVILDVTYAEALGLELAPSGTELKVTTPFNETTVKGCFVVGDMASPAKVVVAGLSSGTFAAAGVVMQLQDD